MNGTVVGFISEKGGVGKTSACYHIAIALGRYHDKKVLVVDTDYQRGGITGRFDSSLLENFKKGSMNSITLYHVFRALYSDTDIPTPDVVQTRYPNVDLLPSDPRLTEVSIDKLPGSNNIRENNLKLFNHLSAIANALNLLKNEYNYVLIDTHPETSELMRSVIYACDYCVSPVKLDEQSSVGVPSAIEAINGVNRDVMILQETLDVAKNYEPTIYKGAIGMMAREYANNLKWTESVQFSRLGASGGVFEAYVTEGDGLRQAAASHCLVFDVNGINAQKQSAQFLNLTKEIMQRCS
jgi:chromosome partitioning protein